MLHTLSKWAWVFPLLIIACLLIQTIGEPVEVISFAAPAGVDTPVTLAPGQTLTYTHQPEITAADQLLLKSGGNSVAPLKIVLTQAEQTISSFEGRPKNVYPDTELHVIDPSDQAYLASAYWWQVAMPGIKLSDAAPLTVTITNIATEPVSFALEIDDSKQLGDSLSVNQRDEAGNIGIAWLADAGLREHLGYHFVVGRRLLLVLLLATASLLLAAGSQYLARRRWWPYYFLAAVAILYTFPLYLHPGGWGVWDWPEAASYYSAAAQSFRAGQFPLWTPLMCGGTPLWHEPQPYWVSPSFLLTTLFGLSVGSQLGIALNVFIGLAGMYTLTRSLKLSTSSALLAAVIYSLSGFFANHIAAGQMLWLTIAWVPWVFYFFLKGLRSHTAIVWTAATYLLILLAGRVYITAYLTLALPLLLLGMVIHKQVQPRRAVWLLGMVALAIAGLGALKIIPLFSYLEALGHTLEEASPISLRQIPRSLLERNLPPVPQGNLGDGLSMEHVAYIGFFPLMLGLIGIALTLLPRFARFRPWLYVGLLFLLTTTLPLSLNPIEFLPVFNQLHNPGRSLLMVVFCLAIFAGLGWQYLAPILRKYVRAPLGFLLVLLIVMDFVFLARPAFLQTFAQPKQRFESSEEFHQVADYRDNALPIVAAGYGAANYCAPHARLWHEDARVRTPADSDYQGEVYVEHNRAAVRDWHFNGRQIKVALGTVTQADTIIINQKYDRGWRDTAGHTLRPHEGLIALPITAEDSQTTVTLLYTPPGWYVGLAISLISLLLISGYFLKHHGSPASTR